ncbi:hypothetical protein [Fodinibius sp.]|uniref:hypothetical protein n=1 Tax=Fodinibius sp. TaxID=1872440 RepID=UPI002ACE2F9E|nr:hypothetical protein [Fodinibius sp.]MDZ7658045.1 hypothetical protein [Fodinibius sp.]
MSGILVKHKDGRKGIAYRKDQNKPGLVDKVVVQFLDEDMNKDGAKRSVKAEKLTQIGFVD